MSRCTAGWRRVAREPLVHFGVIGLVLFALDPGAAPPLRVVDEAAASEPQQVVIDASVDEEIRAHLRRRLGRPATDDEWTEATERWIDEEVLYREGLARDLDRFDPVIRERVASRMSYVLEQSIVIPEPAEAELRAYFDANRERWTVPERVDFEHVFVAGHDAGAQARLDQFASALDAGAMPERLGDRFGGGRRYRGRRVADLARSFGDAFATGLADQPVGPWQQRRSRFGLHLVRVERTTPGRAADFAAAKLDARKAWQDERRAVELRAAVERTRSGWEVVRP